MQTQASGSNIAMNGSQEHPLKTLPLYNKPHFNDAKVNHRKISEDEEPDQSSTSVKCKVIAIVVLAALTSAVGYIAFLELRRRAVVYLIEELTAHNLGPKQCLFCETHFFPSYLYRRL